MKKRILSAILLCFLLILTTCCHEASVDAATNKYGILIADRLENYIFYDLNGGDESQSVEKNGAGNIMIPLKKVCSYFEDITYSYDFSTTKATLVNQVTGKKLVISANSKTAYTYTKNSSKRTEVALYAKTYISDHSKALMVPISALKYILKKTTGYKYYAKSKIRTAGYDCESFNGIMIYNPYKKVSALPEATKVSYSSDKSVSNIASVTIPEGYSVPQIVSLLVKKGVCISSKCLYEAMNHVDYDTYSMFDRRVLTDEICFPLEGYLYPDTYEFYKNSEASQVLSKILKNSNQKLSKFAKKAAKQNYTLDDILKIASIIGKESGLASEQSKISSVLHNRLDIGMKLQCDASVHYVERYIKPYLKLYTSKDVDYYNSYYNTNKCSALPAGAICNPGSSAITAALNPVESDKLFFYSDDDGVYHYETEEEWKARISEN